MTPSNRRAPSNTVEAIQAAWVRGPIRATLPSRQAPSTNVQVSECAARVAMMSAMPSLAASPGP